MDALEQFAEQLARYRESVQKMSQAEAAERLAIPLDDYIKMEQASPEVPIKFWLKAWDKMQFLDHITKAVSDSDENHRISCALYSDIPGLEYLKPGGENDLDNA